MMTLLLIILESFHADTKLSFNFNSGKYDLRSITSGGKQTEDTFDSFTKDVSYQMVKSIFEKPGKGRPTFTFLFIIDFEGFGIDQLTLGSKYKK